jgi:hypothetical protein
VCPSSCLKGLSPTIGMVKFILSMLVPPSEPLIIQSPIFINELVTPCRVFFVTIMNWLNTLDSGFYYWYIVAALFIMTVESMA